MEAKKARAGQTYPPGMMEEGLTIESTVNETDSDFRQTSHRIRFQLTSSRRQIILNPRLLLFALLNLIQDLRWAEHQRRLFVHDISFPTIRFKRHCRAESTMP